MGGGVVRCKKAVALLEADDEGLVPGAKERERTWSRMKTPRSQGINRRFCDLSIEEVKLQITSHCGWIHYFFLSMAICSLLCIRSENGVNKARREKPKNCCWFVALSKGARRMGNRWLQGTLTRHASRRTSPGQEQDELLQSHGTGWRCRTTG